MWTWRRVKRTGRRKAAGGSKGRIRLDESDFERLGHIQSIKKREIKHVTEPNPILADASLPGYFPDGNSTPISEWLASLPLNRIYLCPVSGLTSEFLRTSNDHSWAFLAGRLHHGLSK